MTDTTTAASPEDGADTETQAAGHRIRTTGLSGTTIGMTNNTYHSSTIVLFDWNGTLVDDGVRAWESTRETLAAIFAAGTSLPDLDTIAATWCLPLAKFYRKLGVPPAELARAERYWNQQMATRTPMPRPGAAETLKRMRQQLITTGVVSAGSPALLIADLRSCKLGELIDHLHAGANDKEAVIAAYRAGSENRVVYVGDTEEDMTAATRAGATPIGIAGGYRPADALRAAGAVHVIEYLHEIEDLVAASMK